MKWFQLFLSLVPMAEEIFAAIEAAIAAGKSPAAVHAAIVAHVAEVPARIAAV